VCADDVCPSVVSVFSHCWNMEFLFPYIRTPNTSGLIHSVNLSVKRQDFSVQGVRGSTECLNKLGCSCFGQELELRVNMQGCAHAGQLRLRGKNGTRNLGGGGNDLPDAFNPFPNAIIWLQMPYCKPWNFRERFIFAIFTNSLSNANLKRTKILTLMH
jgi:hypothetical protein